MWKVLILISRFRFSIPFSLLIFLIQYFPKVFKTMWYPTNVCLTQPLGVNKFPLNQQQEATATIVPTIDFTLTPVTFDLSSEISMPSTTPLCKDVPANFCAWLK